MDLKKLAKSAFSSTQNPEHLLWDIVNKLWKEGGNSFTQVTTNHDYWKGKYEPPQGISDKFYHKETKTTFNIIKQIIETKLNLMLDANFTLNVTPNTTLLSDLQNLKDQQDFADILNHELQNILKNNGFNDLKEEIARWGFIAGFSPIQTTWEDYDNVKGEVKISSIDPTNLKWDKEAKTIEQATFIGYSLKLNPALVKEQYAKNPDGSYNEALCKKINELSVSDNSKMDSKEQKGIVSVQSNETSDLAYTYKNNNIQAGKTIELIVLFLLDDSLYEIQDNDSEEDKKKKKVMQLQYPNGRMIVFSPNKDKKMILEDKPSSENFKNLGNIDLFNPINFNEIIGESEIEDLIPLQNRINGTYLKLRVLIAQHISALLTSTDMELEDSDYVTEPVHSSDNIVKNLPQAFTNNNIAQAMTLLDYIERLKEEGKQIARLNDTILYGERQKGTTSLGQVEAFQESPLSNIRAYQRNFKNTLLRIGEKIITFIQENYNVSRLVQLVNPKYINIIGQNKEKIQDFAYYAKFSQDPKTDEPNLELLNKLGKVIQTIKINKDWKFKVEVVAGTEIPRSRRENAILTDKLYKEGVLGDPEDIDIKEQYLRSLDFPNYQVFIDLQKQKKQQAAQAPPPELTTDQILTNPDLAKAFSDIMKSLEYNSKAKAQILQGLNLEPSVDKLDEAPVQSVTSKADVKDIVSIVPSIVSDNPTEVIAGKVEADELNAQNTKGG